MTLRTIIALHRDRPPAEIRVEVGSLEFPERIAALRASAAEHLAGAIEAQFARVVCDGCGKVADVSIEDPQLPAGWCAREDGEFCEACR